MFGLYEILGNPSGSSWEMIGDPSAPIWKMLGDPSGSRRKQFQQPRLITELTVGLVVENLGFMTQLLGI